MFASRLLRGAHIGAPLLLAASLLSATASAQVAATLVLKEGDTPAGASGPVVLVRAPYINGLGQVGFLGLETTQFVYVNGAIVWLDTNDVNNTLSAGDVKGMGFSDNGAFVYGPHVNGTDSIYTNNGVLFLSGDVAPGITNGTLRDLLTPRMLPNGDVWFVANYNDTGTNSTTGRALYSVPGGNAANAAPILQSGAMVGGGLALDTFGISPERWTVSGNGMHMIALVDLASGSSGNDGGIVVDGMLVAQEDTPNGTFDDWDNFDTVAINNSGDYLFSGDTDGNSTTDEFIAYNGAVVIRQSEIVNGILLNGSVDGVALSNNGQASFVWDYGSTETLLLACDMADVGNTLKVALSDNDMIDIDNDMVADHQVTDFLGIDSNGPAMQITDDGMIYVEVQLDGIDEAIIGVEVACCGDGFARAGEACDDAGESATCNADCSAASCGDFKLNASAGEECDEGGVEAMFCDADCTFPACGDGVTNTSFGEDCDDSGESAQCDDDCSTAVCGDGKLNATAGEQCEDGNMDDGDGCSATCQFESGGQGGMGAGGMGAGGMAAGGMGAGGMAAGGMGGMDATNSSSSTTGGGDTSASGGCNCTTAPTKRGSHGGLALAIGLAGLALARRRRDAE